MCSEEELGRALTQLVRAELIFRRGTPPEATYSFKHALVRDAAYESLLKSRRRHHSRVAEALAKAFPETVEAEPEVVAHHYTAAGLVPAAIPYWRRPGNARSSARRTRRL